MAVLVIAEHDNETLAAGTLNTMTAAAEIDSEIHVLVAGHNASGAAAQASKLEKAAKVLHADSEAFAHNLAENLAETIKTLAGSYSHIVAPASFFGKNVMPRVAALIDKPQISEITAVESATTFQRPVYAGNAIQTVSCDETPLVVTVRPTAFEAMGEGGSATIEAVSDVTETSLATFKGQELTQSERPDLSTASIVISGGRGVASAENFETYIMPTADKLGAAIGASRAAVDAGYMPNDYQVGQTGKVVAPNLYIAVGISGAIQHLAGMKDSKVIVAINKDEEAPIFQIADYGLVGDLFQIMPELEKAL